MFSAKATGHLQVQFQVLVPVNAISSTTLHTSTFGNYSFFVCSEESSPLGNRKTVAGVRLDKTKVVNIQYNEERF